MKHSDNEYSFYAHLIKNSISLTEGDKFLKGELIGKCGYSDYRLEPHLYLQDGQDFFFSKIPIVFGDICLNGNYQARCNIKVGDRLLRQTQKKLRFEFGIIKILLLLSMLEGLKKRPMNHESASFISFYLIYSSSINQFQKRYFLTEDISTTDK